MDKNTITGLILMTAIMFGFLYFSKPSEEDIAAAREQYEQAQAASRAAEERQRAGEAFTSEDGLALIEAVKTMGTANEGEYSFVTPELNLTVTADTILSGKVYAAGAEVDILDLLAGNVQLTNVQRSKASQVVHTLINNSLKYEGFAKFLAGQHQQVTLENDLVSINLNSYGAKVSQVMLKKFTTELTEEPSPIILFNEETDGYGFRFNTADQRMDTRDFNFRTIMEGDTAVTFALEPSENVFWAIRYSLKPNSYTLAMEVMQKGMAAYIPASTSSMEFSWHQKMHRNEKGRTFEERNSGIHYKYVGDSPDDLSSSKDDSESLPGRLRWVAFKNQFFSSILVARDHIANVEVSSKVLKDDDYLKDMQMTGVVPYTAADGKVASFDFYFGPNEYPILSGLDDDLNVGEDLSLTRLIPLGWSLFRWINTLIIIPVFTFLSGFISNYGIIILILTIFIKLILFPFTYKSFKSQAKMRVLAPEIQEINDKYPGDENALKRQQETMSLYSRAGASPFSGCLPMLLQMPILIAMFSFFPSAIELRGQSFLWAHDLSAPDSILTLPFKIPFYGDHVSLFCLLMTIVNVLYIRISMQNQPTSASMPGMKLMQYLMPVMFLFIFNDYASGLSYYYFLSLLITIIQTWIFRRIINEKKVRAELLENAKKPRKKTGFMARLEEAQRQAQAAQRQQAQGKNRRR